MYCADRRLSNKPRDVTLRLMAPLMDKGYSLYIDNYYCEPTLCALLASRQTMVTGTVRANRVGMPKDLSQNLQRGELDYRRKGKVVACKWRDKKDVNTLSTEHPPLLARVQCRGGEKQKPVAVINYIKKNAGVDTSDQLIAYFTMHRKSLKWWKKPFFHLLTLCTIQSMIILNKHRRSKGRKTMPLEKVIKSLLLDMPPVRAAPPVAAAEGPRLPGFRLQGRHFPLPIPPTPSNEKPRRACVVCYARSRNQGASPSALKNRRVQTHSWCAPCGKAMCWESCFEEFHTKKDFTQ